jgi:hypothetical protein
MAGLTPGGADPQPDLLPDMADERNQPSD